jgi:hypothetical protein
MVKGIKGRGMATVTTAITVEAKAREITKEMSDSTYFEPNDPCFH